MKWTIFLISIICISALFGQEGVPVQYDTIKQVFYIENLSLNSVDSDFGTAFFGEDQLVFSSAMKNKSNTNKKWEGTGQRFLNFYMGKIDDKGDVKEFQSMSVSSNSIYHESNAVFTKDKTKVYFTRNNYYGKKKNVERTNTGRIMKIALFIADVDSEGNFYNIVPFPYNSNKYSTGHPALSPDEKTLYFTSDMKGTIGKTDIFKVSINDNNTFSKPVNLGDNINTPGREMFPYIASDGSLYFSSDGREGFGKLDIYKTLASEYDIAAVQNLGTPINSARDDFALIINPDNHRGYFSSNRIGGKGDDDIYFFYDQYILQQRVNDSIKKEEDILAKNPEIIPEITIAVVDEKNKQNLGKTQINIIDDDTGEIVNKVNIDDTGQVTFEVENNKRYKIEAIKPLYKDKVIYVSTEDLAEPKIKRFISLTPETRLNSKNEVIVDLNPIYFDFDSDEITKLAAEELDKVVAMMEKYPNMIIEGASHTDSRGPNAYNQKLSERRAQSTVQYIKTNAANINPELIYAIGYGETKLVNHCSDGVRCTESEHALNRRTEFVIVNIQDFN
jgi:outer membrane protein OmpA-like peptidoglycan-associated protein